MAHFGRGARGILITPLREHFGLSKSPAFEGKKAKHDPAPQLHDPAFDFFGADLELAVKAFQKKKQVAETGLVDEALYQELTGKPFPELFDRALMVVGRLEDHGFGKRFAAHGNDGAGLTAGIIGFTARFASLNRVLAGIDPPITQAAFVTHQITPEQQELYLKFVATIDNNPTKDEALQASRCAQAKKLFHVKGQGKVITPQWKQFLCDVLLSESGIAMQHAVAKRDYFAPAQVIAKKLGLSSEYGAVLAFSVNVQKGLVSVPVAGTERERRIEVVLQHSAGFQKPFKPNFEARHLQLARGIGFPQKVFMDLANWGLSGPDAPSPAVSRILSLGMSSDESMLALPQFEREALAQKLFSERVWERPEVRQRLATAKVPSVTSAKLPGVQSPDLSAAWRGGLLLTKNWQSRRAYLELLLSLDEHPIDCVVLGSPRLGLGNSGWLWTPKKPLALQGTPSLDEKIPSFIEWTGEALQMPLTLRMSSGLVILYMPDGISTRERPLAKCLWSAIGAVDRKPPLIVGWFGGVRLPDANKSILPKAFSEALIRSMQPKNAGPPHTVPELVAMMPEEAIQTWGAACHIAFANEKDFTPLWRKAKTDKKTKKERVISACAAMAPDGSIWMAKATPDEVAGTYMERVKA